MAGSRATDELTAVVRRRRRRPVLVAGAGAFAAAVVVATLIVVLPRSDRPIDPVVDPTDGRTGGRTAEGHSWTPDRIRAAGGFLDFLTGPDGALEARFWSVCTRANCDYAETGDNYDHRVIHSALEVTIDGYRTSGLFGLNGGPDEWPETHLQPFDDDTIYVQDRSRAGSTQQRFRLLNADGTTTDLTMLPTTAQAGAGPDVVRTSAVSAGLARVDQAAGTIQRLDLPDAVFGWAESATDELLWGIANGCVVYWQQPSGDFAHRALDCRSPTADLDIDRGPRARAWFTAERMAVTEMGGSKGLPMALHVSLDRGTSWRRIRVTEDTVDAVRDQLG